MATAESCTGGLLASRITDVPGASAVFLQGFVTYANEAKTAALGVPPELLRQHGAVSHQVAAAMAEGAPAKPRAPPTRSPPPASPALAAARRKSPSAPCTSALRTAQTPRRAPLPFPDRPRDLQRPRHPDCLRPAPSPPGGRWRRQHIAAGRAPNPAVAQASVPCNRTLRRRRHYPRPGGAEPGHRHPCLCDYNLIRRRRHYLRPGRRAAAHFFPIRHK